MRGRVRDLLSASLPPVSSWPLMATGASLPLVIPRYQLELGVETLTEAQRTQLIGSVTGVVSLEWKFDHQIAPIA